MAAWDDRMAWKLFTGHCRYCGVECRGVTCVAHADLPRLELLPVQRSVGTVDEPAVGRRISLVEADLSLFPDTWRKEQRGGYGFIVSVPCRFMGRTEKRVKVLALKASGESVVRYIAPDSFVPGRATS